jgi:hypothetical protein
MADGSGTTSGEELRLEPVHVGTRSRRRALWGVLAVVAVVAGALVVASGGEDAEGPRLPVALGSSGELAATAGTADMSLAWITYVAGEGLPALGGEGPAYRLSGTADEARVRDLAEALGIDGDLTHDDGYWHIESDGAVLEVYEDGGGSWWYSSSARMVVEADTAPSGGGSTDGAPGTGSTGCAPDAATECTFRLAGEPVPATSSIPESCAADGVDCAAVTAVCEPGAVCDAPVEPAPVEPTPPADLPSEGAARQIALGLLEATGMDLTDAKVTVDRPYDAWYVTVEPQIDGLPVTGWMASVGVGSRGAVTSASGTLARPERVGDYPLIDTHAAIDRLNEQQGLGGGPVPAIASDTPTDAITSEVNVATADAPMPTTPCPADDPSCTVMTTGTAVGEAQPTTTTILESCKVQPDGSEVCEGSGSSGSDPGVCYEAVPPVGDEGATETTVVGSECVIDPVPLPGPGRTDVVLTEAERVLVLLGAVDGSGDSYLVPGYRFSNEDGAIVEVAAVADDSLAPTTIPETTIPDRTETTEVPEPPVTTCEILVEDDGSGTTHTIQTCPPSTGDPVVLEPGQTPEVGVGYYVDVDVECGAFLLGDQVWRHLVGDLPGWSFPHEGGTFTLDSPEHGTFVGDAAAEKTATFELDTTGEGCEPAPRS